MNSLRLTLLEDEVEWMCRTVLAIAQRMEAAAGTPQAGDVPVLAQALAAGALKTSHLLWRFGRRVTDRCGAVEASFLREQLQLTDDSPLAPARVSPLGELLTLQDEELAGAVDGATMTVTVSGVISPLRPLISAVRPVHAYLVCTAAEARSNLRLLR